MGIFTPGEQRNTEYLKLKYSPSTPEVAAFIYIPLRVLRKLRFALSLTSEDMVI